MQIHVAAADALRPMLEDPNDLASWYEPASGIIRVLAQGQWTAPQLELHFTALGGLVAERRRSGKQVLVLADVRDSLVQEGDIVERLGRATSGLYEDGDRIAVVVASSLLKMQLKRVVNVANVEFFVSMNAARTWLVAHSQYS